MNVLVTGGAGFIGSNLTSALLKLDKVKRVVVLDNLATGFEKNISMHYGDPKFTFLNGSITNYGMCCNATKDIDVVLHQAALGSVPRSIKDPSRTNEVNITGFVNMLNASVKNKISRFVFAASSSTYGDNTDKIKVESNIGRPLSPYAVTKYVNELYAQVFHTTYDLNFVGLRYFNVYGQNQDPNGAYAAVIPLFMSNIIRDIPITVNGDGSVSRDFTHISNVVSANLKASDLGNTRCVNEIYNVACGKSTSLQTLINLIEQSVDKTANVIYGNPREGDIKHSLANISKAQDLLGYTADVELEEGLRIAAEYYKSLI